MKDQMQGNHSFQAAVKSHLGGETLSRCYQCGTCASSCPVAKISPSFNPRELLKLVLLGEKKEVLTGDSVWLCCSCYNCQERCPQKVEIADVIYALRNLAFQKGHMPHIYSEFATALINEGRIVKTSQFTENKRADLGLPALPKTGVEALRKILSTTGFAKMPAETLEEEA